MAAGARALVVRSPDPLRAGAPVMVASEPPAPREAVTAAPGGNQRGGSMRSRIRSRMTFGNVVAVAALFVALGGGAYAAVGNPFVSRQGRIQGCVSNGVLDVVKAGKHCPKGTTSLPFSQTGPNGKQGSTGSPGTSTAYFVYGGTAAVSLSNSVASLVTVVSKSGVPPGTYVITGKVGLTAQDSHPGTSSQANCQLVDVPTSGSTVGDSAFWTPITNALVVSAYEDQTTLPLALDLTTTKTSTLSIKCEDVTNNNATSSFTLSASNAEISAVQVTALS
jgi:hypothetical protein